MRLILERAEVVAILGKHFDAELDPEKVVIRTDPFEIEVCGLPLANETTASPTSPISSTKRQRADADASADAPPPGYDTDGVPADATGMGLHPAAALAVSKELERQLDLENPGLANRRSGRWSEKAPTHMEDEL